MRTAVGLSLAVLVATVVLLGVAAGCKRAPADPKRVLVFGIDGGSWNVIRPMFEAGELPTLKRLYDSGVHGVLESRPPILSPVVWSTIFTGRPWQEHGVQDWKTSQSQHRKVKALWNITTGLGLDAQIINVPSTWPPESIRGSMVSGFPLSGSTAGGNTGEVVTLDGLERPDLPPIFRKLADQIRPRLSELVVGQWTDWFPVTSPTNTSWRGAMRVLYFEAGRYYLTPIYRTDAGLEITHPAALRAEIDAELGRPYVPEGPGWSRYAADDTPKVLYDHLLQIARIQTDAATMLVARPWDLFVYVDTLVDRVSHPYWAYMRPADYDGVDPAKASRYADVVRQSYRETDAQLAQVLAEAPGDFWVMVISDHGFHSSPDRTKLFGAHDFDGIYIVSGPRTVATEGTRAYLEDVTPTILYLLDRPVAADMKGKVIPEIVQTIARPVTQVPTYEDGTAQGTTDPVDERTWEQLRGLGYVEGAPPRRAGAAPVVEATVAGEAGHPAGTPTVSAPSRD